MMIKRYSLLAVCAVLGFGAREATAQCIVLTSGAGLTYTQNFNTLATSGTTNVLPTAVPGWAINEEGASALNNEQYGAGTGSSNTGDTYSFGTAAVPANRAFGTLLSGTLSPTFGACFINSSGNSINSVTINYLGRQFRLGQNTSGRAQDRLDFTYSTDAVSLTSGTWTDVNALDFSSPVVSGTVGVLATPGDAAVAATLITFGSAIADGATFWIRWTDADLAPGADDGLAVDDLTLVASSSAPVSTNPSATGTATNVAAGGSTTFVGTIIAGTSPASTGLVVSCNLTGVGGSSSFGLTVAGSTISGNYTVPGGTAANTYSLPCIVSDAETRSGFFNISLTVTAPSLSCTDPKTLISVIQGSGASSTLTGQVKDIQGVVIGSYQGASKLNGFYIQDEGDADPATSDGIFIDESVGGSRGAVAKGDTIRLRGTVAETFSQTVMNNVTEQIACTPTFAVSPTDVTLPAATSTFLERYEGMLVKFPQQLRVTDNYNLGRFGEVGLAFVPDYVPGVTFTRLMVGSQVATPGAAANAVIDLNSRSRVILDDGSNNTYSNLTPAANWPQDGGGLAFGNTLRLGDRVNVNGGGVYTPLVAVMGFAFSAYRLQPVPGETITFGPSDNPRPAVAPTVGGRVKVMSANVLNYFTTYTSVDSNARGADNATEFQRQRDKIIAVFKTADPAVIAISELENNATAAIEDLVNDINAFGNSLNTGNPGKWSYINTGVVGTDAIRVGFIYQPALVQPVGLHKVLDSSVDARALTNRNRPAIAQTFKLLTGGKPALQHFTVVANHFKSKGSACTSAPNDPDLNDGQDNCNLSRVSMAQAMIDWLATNPTSDPTPVADRRFLILGDLNAHLKEDAISAFTSTAFLKSPTAGFPAGFPANPKAVYKDLVATLGDKAGYSYLFSGESGALDHALANPSLFKLITGVSEWHINADEPVVLDYNSDYDGNSNHSAQKSAAQLAAYYDAGAFRTSDHDPLLVGFNPLPGDLNDDGIVNAADQTIMRNAIGKTLASVDRRTDYDGDGKITLSDYTRWASYATAYTR